MLEHVEQQSACLFTAEGKPAVDFIGRSEHLDEDFRASAARLLRVHLTQLLCAPGPAAAPVCSHMAPGLRSSRLHACLQEALELINRRRPPWAAPIKVDVVPQLNRAEGHDDKCVPQQPALLAHAPAPSAA